MYDNPFHKPERIESLASLFSREALPDEGAHLTPADTAYLEWADRDEPLFHADLGPTPLQNILYVLLSVVLNIVVLIVLAMFFFPNKPEPMSVEAVFSESIGDQIDIATLDQGNLNPNQAVEYAFNRPNDLPVEDLIVFEEKEKELIDSAAAPFFAQSRIDLRDLLSGRTDPGTRNDLLAKYGGTKETGESVQLALAWLKKQQQKNGSWSLKGPYRDGVGEHFADNPHAASGLALLAFQGDGNTRTFGEYKETVRRGWSWLIRQQNEDGSFFADSRSNSQFSTSGRFYTQAICTIALCELIAMENVEGKGAELRAIAQKAVDYLLQTQNKELGGWRYEVGVGSDLSVTGWVLMALQTARAAELFVPNETLERVSLFLDSVAYDGGAQYIYCRELPDRRPSMTATGLLCREYLGWDRKNPNLLRGAEILIQPENLIHYEPLGESSDEPPEIGGRPPFYTNVYGWYSASMALKHLGPYSKYWRTWNESLVAEVPAHQQKPNMPETGSWNPDLDAYRFGGGRLYVTALSVLCLEVYYRHLSLYLNP